MMLMRAAQHQRLHRRGPKLPDEQHDEHEQEGQILQLRDEQPVLMNRVFATAVKVLKRPKKVSVGQEAGSSPMKKWRENLPVTLTHLL
jgi:hypothetical protein